MHPLNEGEIVVNLAEKMLDISLKKYEEIKEHIYSNVVTVIEASALQGRISCEFYYYLGTNVIRRLKDDGFNVVVNDDSSVRVCWNDRSLYEGKNNVS